MFVKYKEKFLAERVEINANLIKNGKQLSNLEECVEKAITMSSKLASLWDCGDYENKQALQNLVFPEGMTYDRKKDRCRTIRVNSIFRCIAELAGILGDEKSGNNTLLSTVSASVENTGVEPVTSCMPCKRSSQMS